MHDSVKRQVIFNVLVPLELIQGEVTRQTGAIAELGEYTGVVESILDVIYRNRSFVRGGTAIMLLRALGLPHPVAEELIDYTHDLILANISAAGVHPEPDYDYQYSVDAQGTVRLIVIDPAYGNVVDPLADQLRDELEDGAYVPERLRRRVGLC